MIPDDDCALAPPRCLAYNPSSEDPIMTTTTAKRTTRGATRAVKSSGMRPGRRAKTERAAERTTPKRYTVSDGTLLLNLETEGDWFVVTSPLDPELVTQAKTIEEAFRMAYDLQALLEEYRREITA